MGQLVKCRMCGSDKLELYLDLGKHVPSDAFRLDKKEKQKKYELKTLFCSSCGLSQLSYVVDPIELYQNDYPYETSSNEQGKKHYHDFAKEIVDRFNLTKKDLVIDIGSNVGVLLEGFKKNGTKILGIDPAPNIVKKANARGVETICKFFSALTAEYVLYKYGKASVITATNVFAHVNNLNSFMDGIKTLLSQDGVFIFESPTLSSLVENLGFDSTYHEHLTYLSLAPVVKFVKKFGMEVFDVEEQEVHQGSLRVFIGFKNQHKINKNVDIFLEKEKEIGVNDIKLLKEVGVEFKDKINQLRKLLVMLKSNKKTIALLSAPAKGATLVQCLTEGDNYFDFAAEKTKLKIGRYFPGTNIKVVDEKELLKQQPDYVVLLAWNWTKQILSNELVKKYKSKGGHIIIPLPSVGVIS